MKLKYKNLLIGAVLILFTLSVLPGKGNKSESQQAIVSTDYICSDVKDCPKCVGGNIVKYNTTGYMNDTGGIKDFVGELSYAACIGGRCELSDSCLVWDCPRSGGILNETGGKSECSSIKQTLLDNTLGFINKYPLLLLIIPLAIWAFTKLD